MSRHRNMKHIIEDDYYEYEDYYDDDDDYYEDYDDYGDTSYKPAAPKKTPQQAKQQQQQQQQQQQPKKTTTPKKQAAAAAGTAATATTRSKTTAKTTSAAAAAITTTATVSFAATTKPVTPPTPAITVANIQPPKTPPSKTTTSSAAAAAAPKEIPAILLPQQQQQQQRIPLTVVVLGHVDAGKSTVTGHLLYHHNRHCRRPKDGGIGIGSGTAFQQQQQQAVSKASSTVSTNSNNHKSSSSSSSSTTTSAINYAWLLDEDEQEREHGVTMDIATKHLSCHTFEIILQDAPGHADYVPAMITGTASADAALLTVDATDFNTAYAGGGQLKEHAYLARGLGVQQMLVVVNKMDLVHWNVDKYQQICAELQQFLVHKIGFAANKVRFVPVSGLTGGGIFTRQPEADEWYTGPTLWEALDQFEVPASQLRGSKLLAKPARVLLTDVLAEQGRGGVAVRAKVVQGWIQAGEALVVLPVGDATTLTKLQSLSHPTTSTTTTPERAQYAAVGEVIDAVVNNVDITRLSTGNVLTRPQQRPPLATKCRCKIWILEGLTIPIIRGAQAIFHMHHLDVPCHVSKLIRTLQKDGTTTARDRPRALTANTQAQVELILLAPICMEAFADCRALGRFVLRRSGDSIAVGRIEKVLI